MPIKDQTQSFRHRKGERYICWTDELSVDHKRGAGIVVDELRKQGVRAFAQHENEEGYSRVFIHEADAIAKGLIPPPADNLAKKIVDEYWAAVPGFQAHVAAQQSAATIPATTPAGRNQVFDLGRIRMAAERGKKKPPQSTTEG